ncbi:MAG: TRAFAC clade GTPase domain-containing protein [Bacteroidota bacterium]
MLDCPHYSEDAENIPDTEGEAQPEEEEVSDVALADGAAFYAETAGDRIRSTGGTIVAIIGSTGSGKTTLVASIYDLLGRDESAFDHTFAGSDTLFAFERLCHLARAASGRDVPDTEHTSRQLGLKFLHLELVSRASLDRFHLLFSDRSGEDYEAASNKLEACNELLEVSAADVVLMLVDAEKLVDPALRHPTLSLVKTITESFVAAKLTNGTQRLLVALTKFDLVKGAPEEELSMQLFDQTVQQLRRLFGSEFAEIIRYEIASRPTKNTVPPGTGLRELLIECTKKPVVKKYVPNPTGTPKRTFHRVRE